MSAETTHTVAAVKPTNLKGWLDHPNYKARFNEVLGKRAPQFCAALVQLTNASSRLAACEPRSVIGAAFTAAILDLPIDKNLGFAHIVPYGKEAQFQMGYKGFIQLALRTGQYASINDVVIPEGVLQSFDPLTGELKLDWNAKKSDKAVGYACFFKLTNGFSKTVFWTVEKVEAHARRYSKAVNKPDSPWNTNFDAMALKTVMKAALAKYGILSVEMQRAIVADQAVMKDLDGTPSYPDGTTLEVDAERVETVPTEISKGLTSQVDAPKAEFTPEQREEIIRALEDVMLMDSISESSALATAKKEGLVPEGIDDVWNLPTASLEKLRAILSPKTAAKKTKTKAGEQPEGGAQ